MAPVPKKPSESNEGPSDRRADAADGVPVSSTSGAAAPGSDGDGDAFLAGAAAASPPAWRELYRRRVDLADVVGSPGLPELSALAKLLATTFGGWCDQMPGVDHPFLFGSFSARLAGPPDDQARAFIGRLNAALVGTELPPEQMSVLVAKRSATGTHVVVQQTIRGAEVVGARFQVHIDDDGRPFGLTGRPVGDIPARDPGEPPPTPDADATEAIRDVFNVPPDVPIAIQRVVFPLPGDAVWAFQGRFVTRDPVADIRAYVRADDLAPMLSHNVASAALRGEAKVFPVNPFRTPTMKIVRLDHIGPVPADRLAGSVVEVRPASGTPFAHALRDCRLEPGDAGFDEAQTYYHLCGAIRYFESILDRSLFEAAPFTPITAIIHDPRSRNNSFFIPDSGELLFGDFGSRPTSRSADIIYHEFGHAVSDAICRLGRGMEADTPARGMSEGYSDYFQASAFDHPSIGDFIANRPEGMRDISKAGLRFGAGFGGEEHTSGEVWASLLWAFRERCGAGVADIVAIESLQFLDAAPTFETGLAALVQADRQLFPRDGRTGRHEEVLAEEFDRRQPV